jgi:hypothetical protein
MNGISNCLLKGAEYVGEIEVDFSSLRDRLVPIEPVVKSNKKKLGKRHYRIDFTMAIKVVDRDLECKSSQMRIYFPSILSINVLS